jgi:hypothetical protein
MKHIKISIEPCTKYRFTHKHGSYIYIVNITFVAIDHKKGKYNKKNKIYQKTFMFAKNSNNLMSYPPLSSSIMISNTTQFIMSP